MSIPSMDVAGSRNGLHIHALLEIESDIGGGQIEGPVPQSELTAQRIAARPGGAVAHLELTGCSGDKAA